MERTLKDMAGSAVPAIVPNRRILARSGISAVWPSRGSVAFNDVEATGGAQQVLGGQGRVLRLPRRVGPAYRRPAPRRREASQTMLERARCV